jgi:hypothetical protein
MTGSKKDHFSMSINNFKALVETPEHCSHGIRLEEIGNRIFPQEKRAFLHIPAGAQGIFGYNGQPFQRARKFRVSLRGNGSNPS